MEAAVIYLDRERCERTVERYNHRFTDYTAPDGGAAADRAKSEISVKTFTSYASCGMITEMVIPVNIRGLQASQDNGYAEYSRCTHRKNRHYSGRYEFESDISPMLFEQMQNRQEVTRKASACENADTPFILSEKIFCGLCGAPMVGVSIDLQSRKYRYYKCSGSHRGKRCEKNAVSQHIIEDTVINSITELLFSEESLSQNKLKYWLDRLKRIDTSNTKLREMIVNIFVNAVFVFDDHLVIVYNFKNDAGTTELTEVTCQLGSGSDIACSSPPRNNLRPFGRRLFFV